MNLYRCPKCKQAVLVAIPASVTCVRCAKPMYRGSKYRKDLRAALEVTR